MRSMTFAPHACSRLRCCTGVSAPSITTIADFECFDDAGKLLDLAFAEKRSGAERAEHDDARLHDVQIDGARETDRFVEFCGRGAVSGRVPRAGATQHRFDD